MIFISTIILLWFRSNYPPYQQLADMYLIFFLIAIVAWNTDYITSIAARKKQTDPPPYTQVINTAFYNENTIIGPIPFFARVASYVFTFAFCVILAMQIGMMNQSIIQIPPFQIVELGAAGKIVVTLAMTLGEDILFFGFLAPTISGVGRLISGGFQLVGTGISLALTPFIFMMFHFLVYGFQDATGSAFTFIFGAVCVLWTLTMRNIIFPNAIHATNNVVLDIAGAIGIA